MAMKIRLARGGSKKRPFHRVVAADSRMPRDGRYIEKLGTYNPLLPKDSEDRVQLNMERVKFWLGEGAKPTDRVARFLEAAGEMEKTERNNPNKAKLGKKAQERLEEKAAAAEEYTAAAVVHTSDYKDGHLTVDDLVLDLRKSSNTLAVTLLDQDGNPVPQVEIDVAWRLRIDSRLAVENILGN